MPPATRQEVHSETKGLFEHLGLGRYFKNLLDKIKSYAAVLNTYFQHRRIFNILIYIQLKFWKGNVHPPRNHEIYFIRSRRDYYC
ncbi:protein of unknown function [Maridesulfovibrio hydrothermalis AM13 = DSM 14728]|uniref:Uncharacterized protein n=1 Tax=Maridesulfovibrio hydrothermalis AM13 = DSM 14728 TaxID=1121451 RepID=L0RCM3_9BACT|nr:protein of unknown function [Maridesulfovibrio hydrothermalis AM13 = DSM 14728]